MLEVMQIFAFSSFLWSMLALLQCSRRGYTGNALVACRRGECFDDAECSSHLACFDYKCKDPCKGPTTSCGVNAQCKVSHILTLVWGMTCVTIGQQPWGGLLLSSWLPGGPSVTVLYHQVWIEIKWGVRIQWIKIVCAKLILIICNN